MITKSVKSMIILMSLSVILACSNTADDKSIMPLAVGNYWTCEVETHVDGSVDPVTKTEHTQIIEEEITWGGYTWYANEKNGAGEYHRNSKDGVHILLLDDEHPDGETNLLLEFPIKVGTSCSPSELIGHIRSKS